MTRTFPPGQGSPGNRLLERLPPDEYRRLLPRLKSVPLKFKQVLYERQAPIHYAYFPTRGVISAIMVMAGGNTIEAASVGNEGVVGLPAFNRAETSFTRVVVQVAGAALRMDAGALEEECRRDSPFRRLLLRAQAAFLARVLQGVACNGLHTVRQRCCRWLMETYDRVGDGALGLTHEFLATMLGVRRSSVSEVLEPLQAEGLVRSRRGTITVLDRAGLEAACCECYRDINTECDRLFA